MASLWSQASSYLGRTNLSVNYAIEDGTPSFYVGPWRVYAANKKSTSSVSSSTSHITRDAVSIWTYMPSERGHQRIKVIEHLKRQVTTLSRLRHPCVLEVVEPLEEARGGISFATERIISTLAASAMESSNPDLQLDETEIQKGFLQLSRALEFLHDTQQIHTNLTPLSVLINAKGDWKLGGFGYLTNLKEAREQGHWAGGGEEDELPLSLQHDMDYMDPMYALDHKLSTSNDMYSLGILLFTTLNKGTTPYQTQGSLNALSSYANQLPKKLHIAKWDLLPYDVQKILTNLITRTDEGRYTAKTFQSLPYFNSMMVSVLKFMERDSFASRTRSEKVQFLRGLYKILPQFSTTLLRRKLLPGLLEAVSDKSLLPYIFPNVFYIAKQLSSLEFSTNVLPRLKTQFTVHDPPQCQMLLLNQTDMFVSKTTPTLFRDEVMPLFYSALDNESIAIQENALQRIPQICELLGYSHIKDKLLPKLVTLFTKTKTLSLKVSSLICFHAMVPLLESPSMSEVLLPTLGRIKTREPSVMVAALAVYEAVSEKVDRHIKAASILPRLWVMAMCPSLNERQFSRFMRAIKTIGDSVEKEQLAHLRDKEQMEKHTDEHAVPRETKSKPALPSTNGGISTGGEIDFEALVGYARQETNATEIDDLFAPSDAMVFKSDDMMTLLHSTPAQVSSSSRSTPRTSMSSSVPAPPAVRSSTEAETKETPSLFDTLVSEKSNMTTELSKSTMALARPTLPASTPSPRSSVSAPPGWGGGLLVPESKPISSTKPKTTKHDWSDFDPLR